MTIQMIAHIEEVMRKAFEQQASDIHLSVASPIVLRIHGRLLPLEGSAVLTPADTESYARQLMNEEQYIKLQDIGEVDFSYGIAGISRFRINIYKQRGSIGLAIRIVPGRIPETSELLLPEVALDLIDKPQGLFLVTGPTGSGKSTTLASLINWLNHKRERHVITLEDPIEFIYDHKKCMINQREVGLDTQSFAQGLRAALRQDPDVILVGELRDLDTIRTAITAAETGHLVLGTLHTTDAAQTVDRLIDVFPAGLQAQIRIQLASILLGVISQRLVQLTSTSNKPTGRKAAFEVLVNTPAVANLIRTEKVFQIKSVMQTGRNLGMQTMEMALRSLVQQGDITVEIARAALSGYDGYEDW